ncbi:MAG TPA: hypothetical protein VGB73_00665 [Pyrinomonadaceae bacterium]
MKNVIRLLRLSALAALFAIPAFAQATPPAGTTTPATTATTEADEKAKADLYERWRSNRKGDPAAQKTAYEAGKEYLQKYGAQEDEYVKAVRKWVNTYESATREFDFKQRLDAKNYNDAFRLGREILAAQPGRVDIPVILGWTGYLATIEKNTANNESAITFARQAIAAIEGGKQPTCLDATGKESPCWNPFKNRDDALGGLYFALGSLVTGSRPEEAVTLFHKSAQQNGFTKTEPTTYANLAAAYELSQYKKYADQYRAMTTANPASAETPEAKALLANLDQVSDRIIDAYARAISLAGDAKYAAQKAAWMKKLTALYKFRNNDSESGLNEFIAGVMSKPMPAVFTGTEVPATTSTTPATAPATGTGNGATSTTTPASSPATSGPATRATTTTTVTTTTTTPNKPAAPSATPRPRQ